MFSRTKSGLLTATGQPTRSLRRAAPCFLLELGDQRNVVNGTKDPIELLNDRNGRLARKNHAKTEVTSSTLPSHLSTDKGFLAVEEYARLVRQFCVDHTSVSQQIRDVPSAFNPIKEVLIGQGYQYLLNGR
jgi:hypothetical protein